MSKNKSSKKSFYKTLGGTFFVLLCCFTPILVVTFGIVGLSVFTPYLDYVLYPALGVMIVLSIVAYRRYKNDRKTCCTTNDVTNKE